MTIEEFKKDIKKDYSQLIYHSPIIKHYCMGMSRFLMLWIIKYFGPIHGYAILKELDKFFEVFITEESLKQSSPSNIYPILNGMEELGLISHEIKTENNKKLKYFNITDDGVYLLDYTYSRFDLIHSNSSWQLLFEDLD